MNAPTAAPGMAARAAAHHALSATLRRKRPLDVSLDEAISGHGLSDRDSGFARAIANETMRRFGQIEALVRQFVPQPPSPHRAGTTTEILFAGVCELLFLDVPAHAAVDGANRLAASDMKALHFKPLINAVLRRVAREGRAVLQEQDAERLNTPDWLWMRWCDAYGEETARAIARVHAGVPPLDLHVREAFLLPRACAGEGDREAVEGELRAAERPPPPLRGISPALRARAEVSSAGQVPIAATLKRDYEDRTNLPGDVVRLAHAGRIELLPGFAEGAFWVQDFAASLPARLFGDLRGQRVIDLCAAPGGKTAQLAACGVEVIAVERDENRAAQLAENLKRLRLAAKLTICDARDFAPDERANHVLLDAPCSATGTIRRHPELPWIKQAGDIAACADVAAELLDAAAQMIAPGGVLVFAVCSLEPEEGPEQIAYFLRRHAEFRRAAIRPDELFGLVQCISPQGDLRTLPCHLQEQGGMDGFYAARLIRS